MKLEHYEPWHFAPLHLNKEERDNPQQVIDEFFQHYNLPEIRADLTAWLEIALSAEDLSLLHTPGNLLFLYHKMEKLFEALYIINGEDKKMIEKLAGRQQQSNPQ
jgi:hypothetical protein